MGEVPIQPTGEAARMLLLSLPVVDEVAGEDVAVDVVEVILQDGTVTLLDAIGIEMLLLEVVVRETLLAETLGIESQIDVLHLLVDLVHVPAASRAPDLARVLPSDEALEGVEEVIRHLLDVVVGIRR